MTDSYARVSFSNAPERQEYIDIIDALRPVLAGLPPKIIAIDGRPGVGKSTLGRFLSWKFNISLVETDLYLQPRTGDYVYREGDFKRLVLARLNRNRPIIVEGVVCLKLLKSCGLSQDYWLHVICDQSLSKPSPSYEEYVAAFNPILEADLIANIPAIRNP